MTEDIERIDTDDDGELDDVAVSDVSLFHMERMDDGLAEPREVSDRRPAKFYAPPGTCEYCDRRRAASARSMRAVREKGSDA
jgi:hypothetical protein